MNLLILYSKRISLFLLFSCLTFVLSCNNKNYISIPHLHYAVPDTFKQGIQGKVVFIEGKIAPSGELIGEGSKKGVVRKLYFYELTSIQQVELGENDFIHYTSQDIIDSTETNEYGEYYKYLKEGSYSIFVQEHNRLYSKINEKGLFLPVYIYKDSITKHYLEIDYLATY